MERDEAARWARAIDGGEASLKALEAGLAGDGIELDLALVGLERAIAGAADAERLMAAGRLLPRRVPADASASRRLAGLYLRLWTWLEEPVLPDWRSAEGPLAARLGWLRTAALVEPAAIASLADEPLAQALVGVEIDALLDPGATLGALAASGVPGLEAHAARLVAAALGRARVGPGEAHVALVALTGASSSSLRSGAWEALGSPWAAGYAIAAETIERGLAGDEATAFAALRAATLRGMSGVVAGVVADVEAPPRLRQEALRGLAGLEGAEVSLLLGAARTDVTLFAGAAMEALVALHRRGVFVREGDLGDLLAIYVADVADAADAADAAATVARVAFTCRRALVRRLQAGEPASAPFARRVALLRAIEASQADHEDMFLRTWLVGELDRPRAAGERGVILGALAEPGRELVIAAEERERAEARVLAHAEEAPAAALGALRVVGGEATRAWLSARLGIDPPGAIAPAWIEEHAAALELLWHLGAEDRAARAELLAALGDEPLPAGVLADLGPTMDPAEEVALARRRPRGGAAPRSAALVAEIEALARCERGSLVPAIGRAVVELAAAIAAGHHHDTEAWGEEREQVPEAALAAIRGLGRRLHARGRIRPAIVAVAADDEAAGEGLVAAILAEAAAGERERPEVLAVVLRTMLRVEHPRVRRAALSLRRRREPAIRKLVIPLLAQGGADDLASDLGALVAAGDIESARQAILALAEIGGEAHAIAIAAALDHPNMNLKKAAAQALATAGSPAAVGRVIAWLGQSDNPGLRELLGAALDAIVGEGATATIVAALEREAEPRRRGLLIAALDRRLEIAAIRGAAARRARWAPELLAAVASGTVRPKEGDAAELRAELERHRLLRAAGERAAAVDPVIAAIEREGVDAGRGEALLERVAARPLTVDESTRLRPHLGELLALAGREPGRAGALVEVVAGLVGGRPSADERARVARALPLVLGALAAAPAERRAPLVALVDAVAPAIGAAQSLLVGHVLKNMSKGPNTSGRSPLGRLRRAGLVVEAADVARALADAAGTADPAALERAILVEAFAVGGGDPGHLPSGAADRLDDALAGGPAALERLRGEWKAPTRATVLHLAERFPGLGARTREAALAWLHALQPIDTPAWDRPPEPPPGYRPRAEDFAQPPSATLLARCLAGLGAATEGVRAASLRALARWPDPAIRRRASAAYFAGVVELDAIDEVLAELPSIGEAALGALLDEDRLARVQRWSMWAGRPAELLGPLLARWRVASDRGIREGLARMIDGYPPHAVFAAALPALLRGEWGVLDRIRGPLHPRALPAELVELAAASPIEGVHARVLALVGATSEPAVGAEVTGTGAVELDRAALSARLADPEGRGSSESLVADLAALARAPDDDFVGLCRALLGHRDPRLRLAALRQLRRHGSREDVLEASRIFLGDPRADVRRSAIRSLAHAGEAGAAAIPAAIPAILALADDPHNGVRRAVLEAIRLFGERARGPLIAALRAARPDRRARLQALLDGLERDAGDEEA